MFKFLEDISGEPKKNLVDINLLPPEILLKVFTYFDVRELSVLSQVCKSWYDIARLSSFGRCLVLKLKGENVSSVIKNFVKSGRRLRGIVVTGEWSEDDAKTNEFEVLKYEHVELFKIKYLKSKQDLSVFGVVEKCKNLKHVGIVDIHFKIENIFKHLFVLNNLVSLYIHCKNRIEPIHLSLVLVLAQNCKNLVEISILDFIGGDYRGFINVSFWRFIKEICERIQVLRLNCTLLIQSKSFEEIAKCNRLQILHVYFCFSLTNEGLYRLRHLRNIKELLITHCCHVTNHCWLHTLNGRNFPGLENLVLVECKFLGYENMRYIKSSYPKLKQLRLV